MIFAVEEINHNPALLPGVRLGYHIMDSCDHVHTSLRALFSILSHSMNRQNTLVEDRKGMNHLEEKTKDMQRMLRTIANEGNKEWEIVDFPDEDSTSMSGNVTITESTTDSGRCLTGSPITAVIGLASSSPTGAIAHILGPFSIPLVTITSRCESKYSTRNYAFENKMFYFFRLVILPPVPVSPTSTPTHHSCAQCPVICFKSGVWLSWSNSLDGTGWAL